MKLQVTQENLNRALTNVARIASGRATLPILSNILLQTHNNRLKLISTNLDIAVSQEIGAKVSKEGSITIPARLTQDFVNNLPTGVIELDQEENKLHINTDQYESTINGTPPDDFPVMPAIKKPHTISVSTTELQKGLSQVVFAASTDETRPVLTGVFLHSLNNTLYAVATDSYRLAEKKIAKLSQDVSILIPASAINELLRIMPIEEEQTEITYDDQQVKFRVGEIELVTRLLEGNYPDYRKLIPKNFDNTALLAKKDLQNITKVSSLFARESAGSVNINLNEKKQTINIKAVASQLGENTASASAKVVGSEAITLNSKYIIDSLQALDGEEVLISFNGRIEPSTLTSPKHTDYLHVIMPLKS